ncbi:hypothetical protein GCM10029964_065700 [Kibdelosporangium lantanae]
MLGFEGELLLPTGVFLLGCVLAGWSESDVLCVRIRRAMKVFEANRFDDTLDDDEDTDLKSNATMKFATAVRRQMDYYFTHWRPTAGKKVMDNDQWRTRTARLRSTLHARLVRLYGTSRVPVSKLNWLIRWYAKQAARQWQKNSELPDTRETLQLRPATAPARRRAGHRGPRHHLAGHQLHPHGTVDALGVVVGVAAACVGGAGVTYLVADHRAMAWEQDELDQIYDDETREYQRWTARLGDDPPKDDEMGDWLNKDKAYLKAHAMRRCSLHNRDIIAHVVLTTGMKKARRAGYAAARPGTRTTPCWSSCSARTASARSRSISTS